MRKVLSLLLICVMVFCLFGCNGILSGGEGSSIESSSLLESSEESRIESDILAPKLSNVSLQNTIPGANVRFTFLYEESFIAILHQPGDNYSLSFFDVNKKNLCSQSFDVVPSGELIICFDHGDAYYIVFEGITYAVTGIPTGDLTIEPVADYVYSIERDDTVIWSPDKKWYAYYSDNNVKLCNVETGQTVVPYEGVVSEDNEMDTTASRIGGFNGDKFIYNIAGYEWGYGYGVYNLVTGENKAYDGIYDVYVNPHNAGPGKVSYELFNEEIGYIYLDKPDEMISIYNTEDENELSPRMGYTFTGFYAGDGKYYCVISETENGNILFSILNASDDYSLYYTYDNLSTITYYVSGSSVVFVNETINENTYTVIELP